jgi:DNA-directed RNA polymerase subunit M/transcription elongation factor TFIIS
LLLNGAKKKFLKFLIGKKFLHVFFARKKRKKKETFWGAMIEEDEKAFFSTYEQRKIAERMTIEEKVTKLLDNHQSQLQCTRCKKFKVVQTYKNTRLGLDEPAVMFCECQACGKKWSER